MVTISGAIMSRKRFIQVDAETGELEQGFVAYIAPKRQNGFSKEGWIAMAQGMAMVNLAKSAKMDGEALRVFLVLCSHLEYENFILTPQTEMAEKIGMAKSHFNRALKKLLDEGVVERGPKIGRMVSLKFNPEYAWKGSAKGHQEALKDRSAALQERMNAAGISVIEGGRDPNTIDLIDGKTDRERE
jgi:DNA-binding transcriptional regulator YhcF (GntR family)